MKKQRGMYEYDTEEIEIESLKYAEMKVEDIKKVIPFYIEYYNNHEGSGWTPQTAYKRIHQVLTMEESFALLVKNESEIIGFSMGYYKQYDDIVSYVLEEIVIASTFQNKGIGSALLQTIETCVKSKGAACIELLSVKDEMHEHFYGKAKFATAKNFVPKVKWFV